MAVRSAFLGPLAVVLPLAVAAAVPSLPAQERDAERPRARDAGVVVGVFRPGPNNAITDVGRELGRYRYMDELEAGPDPGAGAGGRRGTGAPTAPRADGVPDHGSPGGPWLVEGGSIMIVLATDAPQTARDLERLSGRAMTGLAPTGSYAANSSGDYVMAFSTAEGVRRPRSSPEPWRQETALNPQMSPLFAAVAEATEEAIYASLFRAVPVTGRGSTLEALPLERTLEILERHGALGRDLLRPHGRRR